MHAFVYVPECVRVRMHICTRVCVCMYIRMYMRSNFSSFPQYFVPVIRFTC